jgi:hypothetical protein
MANNIMDIMRIAPYHNIDINLISEINIKYVAINGNDKDATGKIGRPFATISAAMDSITDASIINQYVIKITPGTYQEIAEINNKDYITVSGSGEKSTTIIAVPGENLFNFSQYSIIENMKLVGPTSILINGYNGEASGYLSKIIIDECSIGVLNRHVDSRIEFACAYAEAATGSIGDFVKTTAGLIHLRNCTVYGNPTIGNLLNADGSTAEIEACNISTLSTNCTNSYYINNGGTIGVFNALAAHSTNGLRIGSDGSGSTFLGRTIDIRATSKDIFNESLTADINLIAVNMSRAKIDSVCDFNATGWDPTEEKFRREGDISIGLDGYGHTLQVGEGGSYKYGVRVLTYDGADFAEITNGDSIEFPNNNVNTCIYFGDDKSLKFYGLSYIMGATPITLGTGSIIWEYYDTTNNWQEFNILNTLTGYSDSYNGSSFIGNDEEIHTIRFDQDIKTGVTESNATNSGMVACDINSITGMWVRCRISGAITTSPTFKSVRVKPNYMSIRGNGTQSQHGEARSLININLPFGDSGSGGASKTLDISSNISYPFWNNSLADGSTTSLYFRFVITEGVDTSSGLIIKYLVSTAYNGIADKAAKITTYTSKIKSGNAFDGANAEVSQNCNFAYTANEVANLGHIYTLCDRIDISDMSEDDIVFFMIQREGGHVDDTLTNTLDFANVWIEYRQWQNGKNIS